MRTGDELRVLGTTFVLVRSTDETNGERVEFEITLQPGAPSPPRHFHPNQTEEWHVLAGTLSAYVGGSWRELRAGDSVSMPPGDVHTLANRSAEVVRVRDVHLPAGEFEHYVETLGRLSREGKLKGTRDPASLVRLSMVLTEHRRRGGQVTASRIQRSAESLLAAAGRLFRVGL